MDTKIKIAEQYERVANELLRKAKLLRSGIDPSKCEYGKYTNKFYGKECKSCGSPKMVLCDIKAGGKKSHSSKKCNKQDCESFKPLKA